MNSNVFKTNKDLVEHQFFMQVMSLKKIPKYDKKLIVDFSTNKKFKEEFVDMIVDRVFIIMNCSIKKIKNKPIKEIIQYLEVQKQKRAIYGR